MAAMMVCPSCGKYLAEFGDMDKGREGNWYRVYDSLENLAEHTGEYTINEKSYWNIIIKVSEQIYQSALSKLAADDIIECAWDDDTNKMVFWIEDDENNKKAINEKPL